MTMENKELVWVEKEVAEQYKLAQSPDEKDQVILAACKRLRGETQASVDSLDDSVLMIKAAAAKARIATTQALNEQEEKGYAEWAAFSKKMSELCKQINSTNDPIERVKKGIDEMNAKINDGVYLNKLERTIESLQKIEAIISGPSGKIILDFLSHLSEAKK